MTDDIRNVCDELGLKGMELVDCLDRVSEGWRDAKIGDAIDELMYAVGWLIVGLTAYVFVAAWRRAWAD